MIRNRHSIRLKEYNYSQSGYYFITLVTKDRMQIFGNICNGKIVLNKEGHTTLRILNILEKRYRLIMDAFQIMPNHIHLLIHLIASHGDAPQKRSLISQSIGYLKMNISKQIGKSVFQRNYYERIIRDEKEYIAVKMYIRNNLQNWEYDMENRKQ